MNENQPILCRAAVQLAPTATGEMMYMPGGVQRITPVGADTSLSSPPGSIVSLIPDGIDTAKFCMTPSAHWMMPETMVNLKMQPTAALARWESCPPRKGSGIKQH